MLKKLPGILQLVIHPGAACRGWERAEEILPALCRYVWSSSAQLGPGPPADTARPASPQRPLPICGKNGHLPCLQESRALPPGAQGPGPCVRVPQHGSGSGKACEPLMSAPRVSAMRSAAGRPCSWMPNNPDWWY